MANFKAISGLFYILLEVSFRYTDDVLFDLSKLPGKEKKRKRAEKVKEVFSVSNVCERTLYLDSNISLYKQEVQSLMKKYNLAVQDISFFSFRKDIDCEFCGKYFKNNLWKNYHLIHKHLGNSLSCKETIFSEFEAEMLQVKNAFTTKNYHLPICLSYFFRFFKASIKYKGEINSPERAALNFCIKLGAAFQEANVSVLFKVFYMLGFALAFMVLGMFFAVRIILTIYDD